MKSETKKALIRVLGRVIIELIIGLLLLYIEYLIFKGC